MQVPLADREPGELRTLEQLREHYHLLQEDGGHRDRAKTVSYNVVDEALVTVPLHQVCTDSFQCQQYLSQLYLQKHNI